MPIFRAVLMIRQAISPRLAIRIFWNNGPPGPSSAGLNGQGFYGVAASP
jgi:hypothetical protein